ncbi:MAG: hypothetical protein NXI24_20780 [bacterium]|nr:hypothetical protein [bacterium]
MRKMIVEVNDQEICRRLEILQNSEKEDLAPSLMKRLLESPEDFDAREVPEPYTQYVKHYLYMVKRDSREKARDRDGGDAPTPTRRKKSAAGKSAGRTAARKSAREKPDAEKSRATKKTANQ